MVKYSDFVTVKSFCELHPSIKSTIVRRLIHKKEETGFDSCIKKDGRTVLISISAALNWANSLEEGSYYKGFFKQWFLYEKMKGVMK